MRFRRTAKVERHSTGPDARADTFRVRVGCIPLHQATTGDHFRAMNVVVSTPPAIDRRCSLERAAQHRLVELHDVLHDDPGDPFELSIA